MSKANRPSFITLPDTAEHACVLDFLVQQFPHIDRETWLTRIQSRKVFWRDGDFINSDEPFVPKQTLGYYREVPEEPQIPFEETILELNPHFLIAHKPPFLPVMPGGIFVNECLQERLIKRTGIEELQAVHRLDRDTSGLVMFSTNPETRGDYHQLFAERNIKKEYQAVAAVHDKGSILGRSWHIKNHLKRSTPQFRFQNSNDTNGQYAESIIECIAQTDDQALFNLSPITGRTHQLRLHMMEIGYPILNDRFYPELQPKEEDNFQKPMQLLAKTLQFIDPVDKQERAFSSPFSLTLS